MRGVSSEGQPKLAHQVPQKPCPRGVQEKGWMCSREGFEEVVRKSSSGWHGGGKGGRFEEGWCRAPSQTVPSAGRVSGGSWYPRSWLIGEDPLPAGPRARGPSSGGGGHPCPDAAAGKHAHVYIFLARGAARRQLCGCSGMMNLCRCLAQLMPMHFEDLNLI